MKTLLQLLGAILIIFALAAVFITSLVSEQHTHGGGAQVDEYVEPRSHSARLVTVWQNGEAIREYISDGRVVTWKLSTMRFYVDGERHNAMGTVTSEPVPEGYDDVQNPAD